VSTNTRYCNAMNQPGTRIATYSAKVREGGVLFQGCQNIVHSASTNWSVSLEGTQVCVHSMRTRDLIAEFRREVDTANIYC